MSDDEKTLPAHFEMSWRAKWSTDGCRTLQEMAERLRSRADELEEMAGAGVTLVEPVGDDYALMETADPAVAERFGFFAADPTVEVLDRDGNAVLPFKASRYV